MKSILSGNDITVLTVTKYRLIRTSAMCTRKSYTDIQNILFKRQFRTANIEKFLGREYSR